MSRASLMPRITLISPSGSGLSTARATGQASWTVVAATVLIAFCALQPVQAQQTDLSQLSAAERSRLASVTEVWQQVPVVQTTAGRPSDAIDLSQLSSWQTAGKPGQAALWQAGGADGTAFTVKAGTGDIETKQVFCDVQLHLEWRTPTAVSDKVGQQRNNSGVFLQSRYEIQILDSYQNPTYSNGQAASLYKQRAPLVNASLPAGQWQSYDIIYRAPRFKDTQLLEPASVTVLHNGVLVQHNTQIHGNTEWIGAPSYQPHGCAPLKLQDHGDAVSFRNIWLRPL